MKINVLGSEISTYYVFLFLSFLITTFLIFFYSYRNKLNLKKMAGTYFFVFFGTMIGMFYFPYLIGSTEHSSLASIIPGILFGFIFLKLTKNSLKYLDVIVLFGFISLIVFRIGCFLKLDDFGVPTTLFFGVVDTSYGIFSQPLHPTPIYMILLNLVIFCFLFYLYSIRGISFFKKFPGNLTLSSLIIYSFFRLSLIEPLREYGGTSLKYIQATGLLIIFLISLITLIAYRRKYLNTKNIFN